MTADVGVPTVRRPLAPVWLWVSLLGTLPLLFPLLLDPESSSSPRSSRAAP